MKQTRKQIEANLRNKLASQYKEKTELLKAEKSSLQKHLNETYERARRAEIERDELKEKVALYEDWNCRLQEFMDMNEDDRKAYVENLHKSNELNAKLERFGFYSDLLSKIFIPQMFGFESHTGYKFKIMNFFHCTHVIFLYVIGR